VAPRVPSLKVVLAGATGGDVQVTLDGKPYPSALVGMASPIDPGSHTLEAKSSSAAADPVSVTVSEGAKETATLDLKATASAEPVAATPSLPSDVPPEPPPAPRTGLQVGGWIAVGVGVAGMAAGTFFVIKNHSDRSDANALCNSSGCPESKRSEIASFDDSANSAATLSWISYGVGAAGLIGGAVLLWVGHGKPARAHTGQVTPWFGGARAMGVRVVF
jgi:hypothetical protein